MLKGNTIGENTILSKKKSGKLWLLAMVMMLLLGCVGCKDDVQVKLTTGLNEGELFRIEKKACMEAEARLFLMNQKNQYEGAYGENIWKASVGDTTFAGKMKDQLQAFLYQLKGMVLMAENRGISLSDEEKALAAAAAAEYMMGLSGEAKSYLNISEDQLTQLYQEYRLAERLVAQVTAIVEEEISDDEARVIEVQQIVFPLSITGEDGNIVPVAVEEKTELRKKAQEAADRAMAGDSFTLLQETYSSEPAGNIRVSRFDVEEAWEMAVFSLGKEEISGVIETKDALYVVRCINNLLSEETLTNKEVIRERKKAQIFYQEYNAYVAKLLVQNKEEGWQSLAFTNWVPDCDVDFYEVYETIFHADNQWSNQGKKIKKNMSPVYCVLVDRRHIFLLRRQQLTITSGRNFVKKARIFIRA